jgi:prepilin peptidase CpaA
MFSPLPLLAALTAIAALWDWQTGRIPNQLVFAGGIVGLLVSLSAAGPLGLAHGALGAAVGLGALFVPWTHGWVGGGDVKLLAACGAFVGWQGVLALLLVGTALHGLVTAGVLLAARLRSERVKGAPFAPSLALASLALVAGQPALLTPL